VCNNVIASFSLRAWQLAGFVSLRDLKVAAISSHRFKRSALQTSVTGKQMVLAFHPKQVMLVSMEKSWYRKMFSHPQKPASEPALPDADYGDADVQFGMGLKFANGKGTTRDYAQAAEWYHKAADQSHSLAQFNLGMMYANGQGVARDAAQSVMWFSRAAGRRRGPIQFG